jgi:hypothetical protein
MVKTVRFAAHIARFRSRKFKSLYRNPLVGGRVFPHTVTHDPHGIGP